jgi:hypothetical protein
MKRVERCSQLLRHTALALTLGLVVMIPLERLFPGFVAPYVNLPELGLFTFLLLVASMIVSARYD